MNPVFEHSMAEWLEELLLRQVYSHLERFQVFLFKIGLVFELEPQLV